MVIDKITIPKTEIKVSRICFGGEQLGGFKLGNYNINDTIYAARKAIDSGINFFDTADCYNLGRSEENISRIMKNINREDIVISTKFGVRFDKNKNIVFYDNSLKWIDEALKNSINRLETDYIDLYQMHYWDKNTPIDSIFNFLEKKCEEGIIRYYGVTNMGDLTEYALIYPHLTTFSNEISLVNLKNKKIIESNINNKLCFMAYGVLGQGILTGKYKHDSVFDDVDRRKNEKYINFHGEKLKENIKIVEEIKRGICDRKGVSIAQIAIKWVLDKYRNSVAIVGIKNVDNLMDNICIFDWSLSLDEMEFIENVIVK